MFLSGEAPAPRPAVGYFFEAFRTPAAAAPAAASAASRAPTNSTRFVLSIWSHSRRTRAIVLRDPCATVPIVRRAAVVPSADSAAIVAPARLARCASSFNNACSPTGFDDPRREVRRRGVLRRAPDLAAAAPEADVFRLVDVLRRRVVVRLRAPPADLEAPDELLEAEEAVPVPSLSVTVSSLSA
jgi:hypothetical protein